MHLYATRPARWRHPRPRSSANTLRVIQPGIPIPTSQTTASANARHLNRRASGRPSLNASASPTLHPRPRPRPRRRRRRRRRRRLLWMRYCCTVWRVCGTALALEPNCLEPCLCKHGTSPPSGGIYLYKKN
jgi:hypothetical protein